MNRLANAAKNPLLPTLLGWGDPSPVAGNFDNARLDPTALDALLNLPDEMKGDGWGAKSLGTARWLPVQAMI